MKARVQFPRGAVRASANGAGASRLRGAARASLRRGAVLLFVLVLIVVTAAAITRFMEKAMAEMAGEGYYVQRERLRADAYSALETTLGVIAEFREVDGGLFAPAQGWGDPLGFGGHVPREGVAIEVAFTDENAKLSLRQAENEEAAFLALFTDLGFAADEVQELTDCLLDWIDKDDTPRPYGAETSDYEGLELPHKAANGALRSFEELAAVKAFSELMFTETGFPTERFEQFKQRVSLYSNGTLNLNTAGDDVLRLTGLFSDPQLAALGTALDTVEGARGTAGGRYYRSLGEISDQAGALPQGARFSVRTQTLGIVITVKEREASFRLRAVVNLDSASARANTRADPRVANATGTRPGGVVGAPGQLQYPFGFLELVEDPPPTTIAPPNPTP